MWEIKTVPFQLESKLIEESDRWLFKGYASVFDVPDRGNDIVRPGAFTRTIQHHKGRFPVVFMHEKTMIIGGTSGLEENNKGLYLNPGFLLKGIQAAEETKILMDAGVVDGMSFSYRAINPVHEGKYRILREVAVGEFTVAPSSMIMHPDALIGEKLFEVLDASTRWIAEEMDKLSRYQPNPFDSYDLRVQLKAAIHSSLPLADAGTPWDIDEAKKRVKAWASNSETSIDWSKFARAFLWVDSENRELIGSYKLMIGDIIDGTLKAVPRAIFAVAGVLQGARGGVDIPSSDIPGVKAAVAAYYKRMDMLPPWSK
jgi:HK97 family phage prohead protease